MSKRRSRPQRGYAATSGDGLVGKVGGMAFNFIGDQDKDAAISEDFQNEELQRQAFGQDVADISGGDEISYQQAMETPLRNAPFKSNVSGWKNALRVAAGYAPIDTAAQMNAQYMANQVNLPMQRANTLATARGLAPIQNEQFKEQERFRTEQSGIREQDRNAIGKYDMPWNQVNPQVRADTVSQYQPARFAQQLAESKSGLSTAELANLKASQESGIAKATYPNRLQAATDTSRAQGSQALYDARYWNNPETELMYRGNLNAKMLAPTIANSQNNLVKLGVNDMVLPIGDYSHTGTPTLPPTAGPSLVNDKDVYFRNAQMQLVPASSWNYATMGSPVGEPIVVPKISMQGAGELRKGADGTYNRFPARKAGGLREESLSEPDNTPIEEPQAKTPPVANSNYNFGYNSLAPTNEQTRIQQQFFDVPRMLEEYNLRRRLSRIAQ
jgi:hypothetical protein